MKPSVKELQEFEDLLGSIRDRSLSPAQEDRLNDLLARHACLQQDYIEYVLTCEILHSYQSATGQDMPELGEPATDADTTGRLWDKAFWQAMAEYERVAPSVAVEHGSPDPAPATERGSSQPAAGKKNNRLLWATAGLSLGLFCLILCLQSLAKERVAVLVDTLNAHWIKAADGVQQGDILYASGVKHTLRSGIIEIEFDAGTRVLIEGPAQFALQVNRIVFDGGRLYVRVPPAAKGFRVDTPSARIVDYATEFGVRIRANGASDVHMIKGRASLTPAAHGHAVKAVFLAKDQAKQVTRSGRINDIPMGALDFVRKIDSHTGLAWHGEPINLADILIGGNGLNTGQQHIGIDPASGMVHDQSDFPAGNKNAGHPGYFRVPDLDGVDGVFVPDGRKGPLTVTSEGHQFLECPATAFTFWTYITGAPLAQLNLCDPLSGKFSGRLYSTTGNPGILIHANGGVTFDLSAIREKLPGVSLSQFSTVCGIVDGEDFGNRAVFWILVDGRKQGEFRATAGDPGRYGEVSVPLREQDRFLTLMVTDGGDDIDHDWTLFGNPYITVTQLP